MNDKPSRPVNSITAANVHMMTASKPVAPAVQGALVVSSAEAAVGNFLDVMSRFAAEAQRRAAENSLTSKDMKVVNESSRALVALAAEQREQAKQNSLALNSDEDIVRLLTDAVTSLGPRGVLILEAALEKVRGAQQKDKNHDKLGSSE